MVLGSLNEQVRKRTKFRKVSVPAETIHASSERDEKLAFNFSQDPQPTKKSLDIYNLIDKLSNVTVLVELAGSRIDVCEVMLRDNYGNSQNSFTSIRLPITKIRANSTNNIVRGNIRKVIYEEQSSEMSKWLIEMNDFYVCMRQGPKTDLIIAPLQLKTTIANSQKTFMKEIQKEVVRRSTFSITTEERDQSKKVDWRNEAVEVEEKTYSINVHVDMSEITIYGRCVGANLDNSYFNIIYIFYFSLSYSGNTMISSRQSQLVF